jgi:hypothetical protein
LVSKQTPSLESWEIWAVAAGIVLSLLSFFVPRILSRTEEEKERDALVGSIDDHFVTSRKRKIHVAKNEAMRK